MASLYRRWEQEQAKRTTKQVVSRHEQELKECTFEPATNAGRIKGNREAHSVPGMQIHLRRMQAAQQRRQEAAALDPAIHPVAPPSMPQVAPAGTAAPASAAPGGRGGAFGSMSESEEEEDGGGIAAELMPLHSGSMVSALNALQPEGEQGPLSGTAELSLSSSGRSRPPGPRPPPEYTSRPSHRAALAGLEQDIAASRMAWERERKHLMTDLEGKRLDHAARTGGSGGGGSGPPPQAAQAGSGQAAPGQGSSVGPSLEAFEALSEEVAEHAVMLRMLTRLQQVRAGREGEQEEALRRLQGGVEANEGGLAAARSEIARLTSLVQQQEQALQRSQAAMAGLTALCGALRKALLELGRKQGSTSQGTAEPEASPPPPSGSVQLDLSPSPHKPQAAEAGEGHPHAAPAPAAGAPLTPVSPPGEGETREGTPPATPAEDADEQGASPSPAQAMHTPTSTSSSPQGEPPTPLSVPPPRPPDEAESPVATGTGSDSSSTVASPSPVLPTFGMPSHLVYSVGGVLAGWLLLAHAPLPSPFPPPADAPLDTAMRQQLEQAAWHQAWCVVHPRAFRCFRQGKLRGWLPLPRCRVTVTALPPLGSARAEQGHTPHRPPRYPEGSGVAGAASASVRSVLAGGRPSRTGGTADPACGMAHLVSPLGKPGTTTGAPDAPGAAAAPLPHTGAAAHVASLLGARGVLQPGGEDCDVTLTITCGPHVLHLQAESDAHTLRWASVLLASAVASGYAGMPLAQAAAQAAATLSLPLADAVQAAWDDAGGAQPGEVSPDTAAATPCRSAYDALAGRQDITQQVLGQAGEPSVIGHLLTGGRVEGLLWKLAVPRKHQAALADAAAAAAAGEQRGLLDMQPLLRWQRRLFRLNTEQWRLEYHDTATLAVLPLSSALACSTLTPAADEAWPAAPGSLPHATDAPGSEVGEEAPLVPWCLAHPGSTVQFGGAGRGGPDAGGPGDAPGTAVLCGEASQAGREAWVAAVENCQAAAQAAM